MDTTTIASVKRAEVISKDPATAVQLLSEQLHQDQSAGVLFFCSADYDAESLEREFKIRFSGSVVGCTSAGEIGSRYQEQGIVAVSFSAEYYRLHPYFIKDLSAFEPSEAKRMADLIRQDLEFSEDFQSGRMFGITLLDGLSVYEEPVTALIHAAVDGIPIVGGSAGDSLKFKETRVFADGAFHSGAGIFLMIETRLPFQTFKLQHFVPSDIDMVITEADPATRTVMEINGDSAAEEYARILGMKIDTLTPQIFARNPVMLQVGDDWYVRSIQKVNADGSLRFYCAIDEGLPLTIACSVGFVKTLENKIEELEASFSHIECTLGFDCILRRLELIEIGKKSRVEAALSRLRFTGFSTFGEQYGAVHVNHTLTGVVLGTR